MSFISYVTGGAKVGGAVGVVSSAAYAGATDRLESNSDPMTLTTFIFSVGSLFLGPPVGAATGAGVYGVKRVFNRIQGASRSTQTMAYGVLGTAAAAIVAYNVGARGI